MVVTRHCNAKKGHNNHVMLRKCRATNLKVNDFEGGGKIVENGLAITGCGDDVGEKWGGNTKLGKKKGNW